MILVSLVIYNLLIFFSSSLTSSDGKRARICCSLFNNPVIELFNAKAYTDDVNVTSFEKSESYFISLEYLSKTSLMFKS